MKKFQLKKVCSRVKQWPWNTWKPLNSSYSKKNTSTHSRGKSWLYSLIILKNGEFFVIFISLLFNNIVSRLRCRIHAGTTTATPLDSFGRSLKKKNEFSNVSHHQIQLRFLQSHFCPLKMSEFFTELFLRSLQLKR